MELSGYPEHFITKNSKLKNYLIKLLGSLWDNKVDIVNMDIVG